MIVGAGDVGQLVARKLLQHPEYGINLVGFVDGEPKERRADLGGTCRSSARVERAAGDRRQLDVERVIVAFSQRPASERRSSSIRVARDRDVQIDIVPRLFEIVGPHAEVHTVEGLPLVGLPPAQAFAALAHAEARDRRRRRARSGSS